MLKLAYFAEVLRASHQAPHSTDTQYCEELKPLVHGDIVIFYMYFDEITERLAYSVFRAKLCPYCHGKGCEGDARETNRCSQGVQAVGRLGVTSLTQVIRRGHLIWLRTACEEDNHQDIWLELATPTQLAAREEGMSPCK